MYGFSVLTTSDRCASGQMDDISGELAVKILENNGYLLIEKKIIPDDFQKISSILDEWSNNSKINLIITTGGTGLTIRDVTPQATLSIIEYEVPGIPDYIRSKSSESNKRAILSRSCAGVKNRTLILNTPGSPSGVSDSLEYVVDLIDHTLLLILSNHGHHLDNEKL